MTESRADQSRDAELRWQTILVRVATGDQGAFAEFYDATAAIVHGVVLRLVREPSLAEELTVRTFHDVWRCASTYDAARGRPSAWLRTLARSRALDVLRSRIREKEALRRLALEQAAQGPSGPPEPDEGRLLTERASLLRDALCTLSGPERCAIELAYFRGMSHSEIAEALEEPLGTVKSRIRVGMAKLRAALAPFQVEP